MVVPGAAEDRVVPRPRLDDVVPPSAQILLAPAVSISRSSPEVPFTVQRAFAGAAGAATSIVVPSSMPATMSRMMRVR
jgi:hypothetical protein